MDKPYALAIMRAYLQGLTECMHQHGNPPLAVVGEYQLVDPEGWVFYWNTQKSVETGRFGDGLIGQGPTIVLADGRLFAGGSGDAMYEDRGIPQVLKRHGIEVEQVIWA
ncbi:hypothetical protein [Labrys neptuniae]